LIEKIDKNSEDYNVIKDEPDPMSEILKDIINKINEIIDRINGS